MKRPLAKRLLSVILVLLVGGAIIVTIGIMFDPIKACEERGGTFVLAGRYCEEAE
ncbi:MULTISPECIES: hypothetical protein [Hyphobacterium]|uniref:Uncharacterized protein n=1 Tax=Hyphobacterium vulgare TaxID=1736751 RepID=A0ABV7A0U6_9PROT